MKRISVMVLFLTINVSSYGNTGLPNFPDRNLEEIICQKLKQNGPLKTTDLLRLVELEDYGGEIKDLNGIEYATNLKKLVISNNQISDISPLSGLKNLQILGLSSNRITDIRVLENLNNLTELRLHNNVISDIAAISKLFNLKKLTLQRNPLGEEAFSLYIPKIKENNPGIIIYHDRGMTPAKSLYFAQRCTVLGFVLLIVVIVIFVLIRKNR